MTDLPSIAQRIATRAHSGQFRRDGKTPYIEHPRSVAAALAGASPDVQAAAWLHDVLEDSPTTAQDLLEAGIPADVVTAVELLTKRKGEPYSEYLARVDRNAIARAVKIADMKANLADAPTATQVMKYRFGLSLLGA